VISVSHSEYGGSMFLRNTLNNLVWEGRAIAQAVSRRLPTAEARVRARGRSCGFVVDKVALGQVFSEYFGFPCQFSFHRLLHIHHHLPSGEGIIGQLVADVPSGRTVVIPYVKGTSEKFSRIGNRLHLRTIFESKHTLRGTDENWTG
jgi:hypothetical protein